MTTLVKPNQIWNSMPGWGIVADLTPPELIAARKLKLFRKLFLAGFTLLLVLVVGCYALAVMAHGSAASDLASEQTRTSQLTAQQRQYQGAVQVQGSIDQVQTQLAGLLTNDVDTATLIGQLRTKLPAAMTLNQLTITINSGATAGAQSTGAAALDASGSTHIGSVTIAGSAKKISDVSAYVDALGTVAGVVSPYPASSTSSGHVVSWTVQLTLTAQLLTHRYDAKKNGAK
jgi:hypothetical protein